jgi:SAM-dependent methyltransferase
MRRALLLSITSFVTFFPILATSHNTIKPQKKIDAEKTLQTVYDGLSGFGIGTEEVKKIEAGGGAPTYGEITTKGTDSLINDLDLGKEDVVFDLGSGEGKFCIQIALETPVKKVVGVELSTSRVRDANTAKNRLEKTKFKAAAKKLEFREENIIDTDLKEATAIFSDSLCFSDDLMKKIAEKIITECKKPNVRLVTFRALPENELFSKRFKKDRDYTLETTWSSGCPAYRYTLMEAK